MIRCRTDEGSNYRAVYVEGFTLRQAIDQDRAISALPYPEFYDIKVTDVCDGGCPWCYQDSTMKAKHPENIVDKVRDIFEPVTMNQRPFQIAYGGGEPTLHPQFIELLQTTRDLEIAPNYTTNGMHLSDEILDATALLCDGVAVSCHTHLAWAHAVRKLIGVGVKTNLHIIISEKESIDRFADIYTAWEGVVHKIILLPYIALGRGKAVGTEFDLLFHVLQQMNMSKIGFGARFHSALKARPSLDVSLYEPEIFSKYIDLETMTMHPSSFDTAHNLPFPQQQHLKE